MNEPSNGAKLSIDGTVRSATRKSRLGSNSTRVGVNVEGKLLTKTSRRTVGKAAKASPWMI
jgi:hypothetical protein